MEWRTSSGFPGRPRQRVVDVSLTLMSLAFVVYAFVPDSTAGLPMLAVGTALATGGIGAALPLLLDDLISAAPPERAGSAASVSQTSNELGIALGLVVLGSLGTLVYRAVLDVPASQRAAEDGIIRALLLAAERGDDGLRDAAQAAYTTAFNVVGMVGGAVMLVVLWLSRRNGHEVAGAPTD